MNLEGIRAERLHTLWLEPEHIACMLSDVRRKLLFVMSRHGPCTIADMAGYMDTYPEALYHHVRKLLGAKMLREVGSKRSGARDQQVFDAVAQNYKIKPQPWDPDYAESCLKMFQAEFNTASKEHQAAIRKYGVKPDPLAFISGRKSDVELDAAKIEELKKRLSDHDEWIAVDPESSEKKPHTIFIAVYPRE